MVFDECTPFPATEEEAAKSMRLSMDWAARSKAAFADRPGRALFGIVQGGVYPELRAESADRLTAIGFDGYALGGLAVGEGQETMFAVLEASVPHLPADRPRYLMGVGRPSDIVGSVRRGIDMFDCVLPTRSGRTGQAFTKGGTINLRNQRHADDPRPVSESCRCPACTGYSRAYLHHLVKAREILGAMLLTWHNLTFFQDLMREIREAVETDRLDELEARLTAAEAEGDIPELETP
jgi:queuine tRNA-ribosyltransferase